ncbi:LOW QUALITY PROTEIN: reticulon-like protein B21 [Durio zibethinus]|uniref:Reticulon-like protein n=1 Tax=Durio zibethinus TaxID=66656 RepID=A0A6P5ZUX8_DURZI|nr:LOW QUALITY PROTEIN: reticulon-like protein B21 [Durio zibethinus]
MDLSSRRAGAKSSVVAGSVWETRMKNDEVKGGIKVFNGEENSNTEENTDGGNKKLSSSKGQTIGSVAVSGKRKTWKSESFEGFERKKTFQIAKGKTEEQCKELSVSVDGIKKSPIRVAKGRSVVHCKDLSLSVDGIKKTPVQVNKGRSEGVRELSKSVDGIERGPIHMKKPRSEVPKRSSDITESGERIEGNSVQLRKAKSDSVKASDQSGNGNGNEENSLQLRRSKSEESKVSVLDDQKKGNHVSVEENEKNPVETDKNGSESEENCKEFGLCQENVISSRTSNGNMVKSSPEVLVVEDDGDGVEDDEEFYEEEEEVEEEEIEVRNEKKSFDIKEMNVPEEKPNKVANEVKKFAEEKHNKVVNEVKKNSQFHNKTAPFSSTVNKQPPPVVKRATSVYTTPSKSTPYSASDDFHYQSFPQTQNKLLNLVDLAMWRDVSKSALVFGMGTFIIISSSYTKDLNISCISVISYLGLVYLAAIFLYRSIICRGVVDTDESTCVLEEVEAVWLLELVLPYLNEFLLKLRALFSGDPVTTMKLAVLLFVLARCGSSITIWKMAKLGFFGVFTVPKVCSSYSHLLTAYGKFWIRRFWDAWDSCTHKKAVAVVIFTLVWNLSSIVARIWAAFMLFVALRYYQQKMVKDDWVEDEGGPGTGETWQGPMGRHGVGPPRAAPNKVKKGS